MGLQVPVPGWFGLVVVNLCVQVIPCSLFRLSLQCALFCEGALLGLMLSSLLSPREGSAAVSGDIQK